MAAVQGNVPKAGLEFNAQRRAVLDNHVRATLALADAVRAGRTPAPDIVVWPENASDIDPLRNLDAYTEIGARDRRPRRAAARRRRPARVRATTCPTPAIVWGPTGSPSAGPGERYVKRHPVPFGEYIPYRSFFRIFSSDVDLVSRDFAAGDRPGVLQLGPARIGDVICFEVAYDDIVHDVVAGGADLLVVQTNNATFGYTDESAQQIAMSRLRAVEAGRAVVHVSTVGVSGLVEPDGRVVAGSRLFTPAVLESALPLRTGFTVATRLGVLPEAAFAAARCPAGGSGRGAPTAAGRRSRGSPGRRGRRARRARGQRRCRMSPEQVRAVPARSLRRALTTAAVVVLAVPIVEIAVAVLLAYRIGVDTTLALVLLGCLGGLWVLRWAGAGARRELRRLRGAGAGGASTVGQDAGEAGLKIGAGFLLLFPGLVTDVAGLLLLVPQVRGLVARRLGHRLRRRFEVAARRVTVRGETVDGVTVTSWVEGDGVPGGAGRPGTTKPPLPAGPGEGPRPTAAMRT